MPTENLWPDQNWVSWNAELPLNCTLFEGKVIRTRTMNRGYLGLQGVHISSSKQAEKKTAASLLIMATKKQSKARLLCIDGLLLVNFAKNHFGGTKHRWLEAPFFFRDVSRIQRFKKG